MESWKDSILLGTHVAIIRFDAFANFVILKIRIYTVAVTLFDVVQIHTFAHIRPSLALYVSHTL